MDNKKRIGNIEADIKNIKENHLAHLQEDVTKVSTNVNWLMKYHWIIMSASIGSLVVGLINALKQ